MKIKGKDHAEGSKERGQEAVQRGSGLDSDGALLSVEAGRSLVAMLGPLLSIFESSIQRHDYRKIRLLS
jgi:hypothetical protein